MPRVTRRNALVLVALVLLAVNLRPAAVSVGPVLDEVRDGLGMSASSAGLLTSLPVLAFALFGEQLSALQVAGMAVAASGVAVASRA